MYNKFRSANCLRREISRNDETFPSIFYLDTGGFCSAKTAIEGIIMHQFFNEKFQRIRKEKKISIVSLAEGMNISRRTIWTWEIGKIKPSEKNIRMLSEKIDVKASEISNLKDSIPTSNELPKLEKYWTNLINFDENIESDRFNETLHMLNRQKNDLKRSSIVVKAILRTTNIMMYIKDARLNYLAANKSFLEMLHLPPELLVMGKNDRFFFSKADAINNTKMDEKVINSGKPVLGLEMRIPGSKNKKWGLISKLPIFNNKKEISGLIATFIDITDRKRGEEERELLETCINAMSEGLGIWNKSDNECLYLSKASKTLYNIPDNGLFNNERKLFLDRLHPDDKEKEIEYLENKSWPKTRVFRLIDNNHKIKWIKSIIFASKPDDIEYNISLDSDITEVRDIEEKNNFLKSALDRCHDVIGIYDISSEKNIYMNAAIERLTGYDINLFYRTKNFFFDNCVSDSYKEERYQYKKNKSWPLRSEVEIIRKDSSRVICEIYVTDEYIFGKYCTVWIIRDISIKKENDRIAEILKLNIDNISDGLSLRYLNDKNSFFMNEKVKKCWGFSTNELEDNQIINKWIKNLTDQKDRVVFRECFKTEVWPSKIIFKYRRPSDKVKTYEGNYSIIDFLGRKCLLAINKEIDFLSTQEQDEKNTIYEIVMDTIAEAFTLRKIGINNKYIFTNKQASNILELSKSELDNGGIDLWDHFILPCDLNQVLIERNKLTEYPKLIEYRLTNSDNKVLRIKEILSKKKYLNKECIASAIMVL